MRKPCPQEMAHPIVISYAYTTGVSFLLNWMGFHFLGRLIAERNKMAHTFLFLLAL